MKTKQTKKPAAKKEAAGKYKPETKFVLMTLTKDGTRKARQFATEAEADTAAKKLKPREYAKVWLANADDIHIRNYITSAK